MSTNTVTGWKRGAKPRPAQIKKIAEYFKICTEELTSESPIAATVADLPNGMVNLIDIIKSQQDTILNLSESVRDLCGSHVSKK